MNESKNKYREFNINEWKTLPVGTSVTIDQMEIVKVSQNGLWSAEWDGEIETIDSYIESQDGEEEFEDAYIVKLSREELRELIQQEGIKLNESKQTKVSGFDARDWKTLPVGTEVMDNGYSPMSVVKITNNLLWSAEWDEVEAIDSYIKGLGRKVVSKDEFLIRQLSKKELRELIEEEGIKLTESKQNKVSGFDARDWKTLSVGTEVMDNSYSPMSIVKVTNNLLWSSEWNDVETIDSYIKDLGRKVVSKDEFLIRKLSRQELQELRDLIEEEGIDIMNESKKEDSVKDLKGLTIEEIFFKVIGRKFEVFDKQGHFTKEALKHYDKVASAYGEDEFDRLCAEEECFLNEEVSKTDKTQIKKTTKTKKLGEAKSLSSSSYKDIIGAHFDYSGDFDFLEIVSDVLDRIDFENADEIDAEVQDAVDSALTYIADQWTIAQHYASGPDSLDWDEVVSEFESDIRSIVDEIKGE